jgi:hypothetical protein
MRNRAGRCAGDKRSDTRDEGDRNLRKEIRVHAKSDHAQERRAGDPAAAQLRSVARLHVEAAQNRYRHPNDKAEEIALTPDSAGDFTVICDHYCGTGHGGMKMKITVVE